MNEGLKAAILWGDTAALQNALKSTWDDEGLRTLWQH